MTDTIVADPTTSEDVRPPDSPDTALNRARIVVLMIGFAVVGAGAGSIFDEFRWVLVFAAVPPALAALALIERSTISRAAGALAGLVVATITAVLVEGGDTNDVVDAVTSGPQGLLSTEWPSPLRPDLVGAVAAAIATATIVSGELARRRRFHLLPLVPMLATYLAAIALSAPRGVNWWWLATMAAIAALFATLRPVGTLHDRIVLLRGERRLVPLLAIAIVLVTAVAIPMTLTTRADPRRNDPPARTAPLLDPIEASRALRNLDPPIDLHVIDPTDSSTPLPGEWRTAALDEYDGRRWAPDLTLRPIGTTLGVAAGPLVQAQVSFLDDNLTLVPLPGAPVEVDADIQTDDARTVVRLDSPPDPGDAVRLVANRAPTTSDAIEVGLATRLVDESTAGFGELAGNLAGDGAPLEQMSQLEATLRNEFVRDSEVQGGGLQLALIERFLRDTRRGTPEQFATGFVLLARSLGVEARIATGFRADPPGPGESLTLRSDDAAVWPELQLADGRWLALDPAPPDEASDIEPPPPEPQVQSPAAPQPPVAPPPEADTEPDETDDTTGEADTDALSTAIVWVSRAALGLGVLVLPFGFAAAVIVGLKYRRRRRRLSAASPTERIRGAWASATDALVDAGLDIEASATDGEIAERGTPIAVDARRELHQLSAMSSAATYGRPRHVDLLAEDAAVYLGDVEQAITTVRTRRQRWQWHLSLRSLRRATRSPVDV